MRRGMARPQTSRRSAPHPPSFTATVGLKRRARYTVSTALADSGLTRADLLSHLVMNVGSGVNNYRMLSGFKLNRFEIWAPGTSAFVPTTASIEWTSTYGPSRIESDTSMTIDAAHVLSQPPPQSLASFWSIGGSNETDVICLITAPVNSVIDINYEIIFQNGETPQNVVSTGNGVEGTVYMTPLFGLTTTNTVVVSYTTLV
jgi:hypothetical protein